MQNSPKQQNKDPIKKYGTGARIMLCAVVLLFAVLAISSISLYQKKESYAEQIAELNTQIASEEARSEEIDAYEEYVGTREYIEQVARERLGLAYPDEIIFRPEE